MGTIQNSMNAMLGTAAAAAAAGKHISNQNKEITLKKAELGVELKNRQEAVYQAGQALHANDLEVSKEMIKDTDPEVAAAQAKAQEKGETLTEDQYLELKQKQALEEAASAEKDFNNRKLLYEWGTQKTKPSSKRLDMANKAFMERKDAVMARRQLKYDLDMAKRKVEITRQALEGVK